MNTKVVYVAGIALLMIGIIFYFIDSGFLTYEKSLSSSYNDDSVEISSSPVSVVNDSTTTTTNGGPAIDKSFVKPTSYQLFKSLSHLNIEDFNKQTVVYQPKLKQPLSQPSSLFSPMQIVFAQSNVKKTPTNYENLTVSVKSIDITTENNVQSLQIALNVYNPNKGSAILETLNYNVYLNNVRLASADIGTKPQGFIDSLSSVYPIIGNQTITLRDTQPLTSEGSSLFNSNGVLINGSKSNSAKSQNPLSNFYIVNGTFSTTLTRGTQSQSSETPYNLQFPIK